MKNRPWGRKRVQSVAIWSRLLHRRISWKSLNVAECKSLEPAESMSNLDKHKGNLAHQDMFAKPWRPRAKPVFFFVFQGKILNQSTHIQTFLGEKNHFFLHDTPRPPSTLLSKSRLKVTPPPVPTHTERTEGRSSFRTVPCFDAAGTEHNLRCVLKQWLIFHYGAES